MTDIFNLIFFQDKPPLSLPYWPDNSWSRKQAKLVDLDIGTWKFLKFEVRLAPGTKLAGKCPRRCPEKMPTGQSGSPLYPTTPKTSSPPWPTSWAKWLWPRPEWCARTWWSRSGQKSPIRGIIGGTFEARLIKDPKYTCRAYYVVIIVTYC